ncbi:MAG: aminotransferase [Cyanobacteria bacterium J06639_1]
MTASIPSPAASAPPADLTQMGLDSLWHPMVQHRGFATKPPKRIARGASSTVTDANGKDYLDGLSGLWCVNVGYGRQELADVAYRHMTELAYYPLSATHEPAIRLAHKLIEMLDYPGKVFFCTSGSEANETAFKMARQYHAQTQPSGSGPRYKIISRYRGYHGHTMGALSATAQAERKLKFEPLVPGFLHVPPPYYYRFGGDRSESSYSQDLIRDLEHTILHEGAQSIAAIIVEPVISGGGVLVPPDDYLAGVRSLCDTYGILLIYDEVVNGFGRTGKRFGHHHWNVQPDIITFAKGITSGYMPLAATVAKQHIFEAFLDDDPLGDSHFRHLTTYGGHPVAAAVALENIAILDREHLDDRAAETGAYLLDRLHQSIGSHPWVGDIRGKGLLIGIELVSDRDTKTPLPSPKVIAITKHCSEAGVIVGRNTNTIPSFTNVLILAPPLILTREESDRMVEAIANGLKAIAP